LSIAYLGRTQLIANSTLPHGIQSLPDFQRQSEPSRLHNLAQLLQQTIERMFKIDYDGIPRGEVKGLDDSTRTRMQTLGLRKFAEELVEPMLQPNWRPGPCGLVAIDKEKGGHRFLAPPSVVDRIRQRGIYNLIGRRLAYLFSRNSFGFMPGRSSLQAVMAVFEAMNRPDLDTLILVDIVRCFPSLPVARVFQEFKTHIGDRTLLRWIEEYLRNRPPQKLVSRVERKLRNAGTLIENDLLSLNALRTRCVGVPEGSALSPLACSLYLRLLITDFERHLDGAVLVHYADNLAVVCRPDQQQAFCDRLVEAGRQYGLTMGEPDIIHRNDGQFGEFLGYGVGWLNATANLTVGPKAALRLTQRLREAYTPTTTSLDLRNTFNERIVPMIAYYRHAQNLLSVCGSGIKDYLVADREWVLSRLTALICGWSKPYQEPYQETEWVSDDWSDAALSCYGDGQHAGDQKPGMDE